MKRIIFIFILILLTNYLYSQDNISEIKSIISSHKLNNSGDITAINKINTGIPGGDNWLVEWTYKRHIDGIEIFIYILNGDKIVAEYDMWNVFNVSEFSDFDIMKDIPGKREGMSSWVVYDYNDDGLDEILNFAFLGRGFFIYIRGYNPEVQDIVTYVEIPFIIIDEKNGPSPIEFITFKGIHGFKVYYFNHEVGGGHGWVSNPDQKNNKWFFYTWDKIQRKFVEVEEVNGLDNELINDVLTEITDVITVEIADNDDNQESAIVQKTNDKNAMPLPLLLAIIGGGIAVGVVVVAILKKKK